MSSILLRTTCVILHVHHVFVRMKAGNVRILLPQAHCVVYNAHCLQDWPRALKATLITANSFITPLSITETKEYLLQCWACRCLVGKVIKQSYTAK